MKSKFLRIGVRLLCLCLCLVSLLSTASCGRKPPEINDVSERFIYLIERSVEINDVLFGAGIPVYKRDALITDKRQIYFGVYQSNYELSMEQSRYFDVEGMKADVEEIFSSNYLKALYETAFDGVLFSDGAYLRFYQEGSKFYQTIGMDNFKYQRKIYDYSTMKIVKPSDDDFVTVEIEAYDIGMSHKRRVIEITFVKENGEWYLNSPTY